MSEPVHDSVEPVDLSLWPAAYDPDKIYTFRKSGCKFGDPIGCRLPDWQYAAIDSAIDNIPEFERRSDVVRNAVYHTLKKFLAEGYIESEVFTSIESSRRTKDEAEWQEKRLKDIISTCKLLAKQEDWRRLESYLAEQLVDALKSREPWRNRLRKILDKWFERCNGR